MSSPYLPWIALSLLTGIACAVIAKKKGRDAALWFFGGALFSIVGVAVVSFVKNKRDNQNHKKKGGVV